jgi:hypothetical protein
VPWGKVVTLTATVKTAGTAVSQGQVNSCDAEARYCTDIHIVGTAQLSTAGTAVFKFVPGPGSHSYRAELVGAKGVTAGPSVIAELTVTTAVVQTHPTTTAIAQSGNPGNYMLTATVTGFGGTVAPTGTVSFLDTSSAATVLGTAELVAGTETAGLSWTNSQTPATKTGPRSIVAGDFNGDGRADIAVGSPGCVSLLLGKGDGTFTVSTADNFAVLANNQTMVAAAFMTLGPEDILIFSNSSSDVNNAQMINGDGKGGEIVGTPFSPGLGTVSAVATGDFNGDGNQDFVIAGITPNSGIAAIAVALGNGNGTFKSPTILPIGGTILAIGVGDFTGNGKVDIEVMTALDGTSDLHVVSIFENDGSGNFSPGPSISESGLNPVSMVVADFNGDGKADLAVANNGDNTVTILLSAGNGGFMQLASPSTGSSPSSIAVGDFNGDKVPDLAVANGGNNTVTILLGNGDGTFTASTSPATGNTPVSLAVADFNGGGTSDLAVANSNNSVNGTVTVLLSQAGLTSAATAKGIAVTGAGAHLVDASYPGDASYIASVSGTTSLTGTTSAASAPVLSPEAGTYTSTQSVTISDATSGATIYYTTNGTTPTTSSVKYTSAVVVSATETIKAIAVASGYTNSAVAAATYTIKPFVAGELMFIVVTPCRIADTRNATGVFGGPELAAGVARTFDVPQSGCGIPSTAVAYSLNVTVVPIQSLGYLTMWPAGEAQPIVSTLNSDGRVKANATITPAGTSGGVTVYASDATQFILDIDGYFVPEGTNTSGLEFYPLTPCRVADTRNATGPLGGPSLTGSGAGRAFPVQSSACGIPSTAKAYSLNITAVPRGGLGYLTTWPTGQAQPVVSTLNSSTGAVTANAAIVPAGGGGDVSIFVSDTADVILDVNGYFAPPATGGLSLYTVTPCRALDTRNGAGDFDGVLAVPVHGSTCAPPATAQAYVLNATVVPERSLSYLTLWAAGEAQPGVSTLNTSDGAVTSNMAIVPTTNGGVDAFSTDSTQFILDISSYFAP